MLSSHTFCCLMSEAVRTAGGYDKGSLRRACLVGLVPGRHVFLVSIICRSQTEDVSERAEGECWAKENTAASEQIQLLRAFNNARFTGKVWITQEISPPGAVAPTCRHRSHGRVEQPWVENGGRGGRGRCSPPASWRCGDTEISCFLQTCDTSSCLRYKV